MAEQTYFHDVQRSAPRSFKPVSDGVINLYLYNFGSNLGVAFMGLKALKLHFQGEKY